MTPRGGPPGVLLAALAAILLVAQQVAGRAIRDAFFLSHFSVAALPNVVLASAVLSLGVAFAATRLFLRASPARVLPPVLVGSAALHLVEWWIARSYPGPASVLVYIHTATLGLTLISGFWSMVNETLDARSMRRNMGRLTGGATVGGLLGALLAAQVAAAGAVADGLLFLIVFQLATGAAIAVFARRGHAGDTRSPSGDVGLLSCIHMLRDTPFLRNMGFIVILGAASATLLDYVLKAEAAAAYRDPGALLRFFALFHGVVSVGSFLVQITLTRVVLERAGLTSTVRSLPGAVLATSLGALLVPGLWSAAVARGGEAVLRNSLFRSGFEPHFAPVPRESKRACKTLIDVGGERAGDALGGLAVKAVLALAPAITRSLLMVLAAAVACISLYLVRRLRRGYVHALEQNLLQHGGHLDLGDMPDDVTRESVLQSLSGIRMDPELLRELRRQLMTDAASPAPESEAPDVSPPAGLAHRAGAAPAVVVPPTSPAPAAATDDPLLAAIAELRSGDLGRVRSALLRHGRMEAALVPHAIRLLAWDAVSETALRSFVRTGPRVAGQLADALLDPEQEFAIRRRVPRVLASMPIPLAARALFEGLNDKRFEVRFQCGRALARLQDTGLILPISNAELERAILQEVAVDRRVWESRRLLEDTESLDGSLFVDRVLAERTNRSLEHVFTLLSLLLPRDPLRIAFRGLHAGDPGLRGTALEYLESVLPPAVRVSLWPFLEPLGAGRRGSGRSREEILSALLESNASIQIDLAAVREALSQPIPTEPKPPS